MRKFISVILALMLVLSTTVVAFNAYNVVDPDAPTIEDALIADEYDGPLAKVYFMMPNGKNGDVATDDVYVHYPDVLDPVTGDVVEEAHDELVIEAGGKAPSWFNEFNKAEDGNHYAGIYWWEAPGSPAAWPGYKMEIDDVDNCVYYAEIPGDDNVTSAIFNNGVDGGTDTSLPIYYMAAQSIDNNMEGAYEGDYDTLWGDTYNEMDFDGCIYVIDPNQVDISPLSRKQSCGGNWYFYYGNGCYGSYRVDAEEFTSVEDCCLNPDHFNEAGEHVGYHEDEPTPTEAPTEAPEPTEAPTEAPVPTEAPTEAPVPTEAPTEAPEPTEAPTEAPVPTEEPADTFIVAGNDATIFGTSWNGNDTNNTMTFANDVWYKEYTVDGAINAVQLKAVKNGETWIGDATGNNVTFNVTEAGTFTVYCDGEKTWVEGDNVEPISELDVQSVTVVGNGSPDGDNWLNNIEWDPAAEANHMTKVGDTAVYEIEYTLGEYDTTDPEFKFAVNDAWTDNFGLADGVIENGVETDAIYNGPTNLKITGLTAGTTITIRLDLTNFDYNSKTGAKMTVTWTEPATEAPTEEPTDAPVPTEAPTDAPVPTEAPTEEPAPALKPNTYYLYGTIASMNQNWSLDPALEMTMVEEGLYKIENIALTKAELGVDQFGNPIKNSDPAGPEVIGDNFKVVKSSKRGTAVSKYFPDGVENNRTVAEDGIYTIYFRPNGDGDPNDGWIKVYTMSDPEGDPAAHGATVGGYMYKFVKTGEYVPPTEVPTEAPTEAPIPTEAPTEAPIPTEAPTEAPVPTEAPTESVVGDTYIVAGNAAEIFGTSWNGNDTNNAMSFANDVWYKEYTVDSAKDAVQLKAVKNGETWIGDATGNNVTFNVTEAGTFTVYCDGEKTWVEGDNVEPISELDVQSVTVVGNGSPDGDNWLNNIEWNPAAEVNHMTKVGDTAVYEIEYTLGEYDTSDPEFKFAINDAWTDNFGLGDNGVIENGVETDAIYNGSTNLKITGLTAGTTITIRLDLTNFDYNSKTGAKMTVTWGSDAPSYILGDANGDGIVDAIDATLIQRYDAQMPVGESFNALAADVNGDGEVDILDVTFIQRYLAGMTVKYPIGNPSNAE